MPGAVVRLKLTLLLLLQLLLQALKAHRAALEAQLESDHRVEVELIHRVSSLHHELEVEHKEIRAALDPMRQSMPNSVSESDKHHHYQQHETASCGDDEGAGGLASSCAAVAGMPPAPLVVDKEEMVQGSPPSLKAALEARQVQEEASRAAAAAAAAAASDAAEAAKKADLKHKQEEEAARSLDLPAEDEEENNGEAKPAEANRTVGPASDTVDPQQAVEGVLEALEEPEYRLRKGPLEKLGSGRFGRWQTRFFYLEPGSSALTYARTARKMESGDTEAEYDLTGSSIRLEGATITIEFGDPNRVFHATQQTRKNSSSSSSSSAVGGLARSPRNGGPGSDDNEGIGDSDDDDDEAHVVRAMSPTFDFKYVYPLFLCLP